MSDEFLKVARQEIWSELDKLEQIVSHCNDDEHILRNSKRIKDHLHKIKGLAPMIGQEKVGEIAKTSDDVLKYIIGNGMLPGSCHVITRAIDDMKKVFQGVNDYDMASFKRLVRDKFPNVPNA